MTESTLTLDGMYATAMGEDVPAYGAAAASVPPLGASTSDLDALLTTYGPWRPLTSSGEEIDEEAAMNSAILAGLVSP
jgi:hypothetical protein